MAHTATKFNYEKNPLSDRQSFTNKIPMAKDLYFQFYYTLLSFYYDYLTGHT
jgi:hypothetical protein